MSRESPADRGTRRHVGSLIRRAQQVHVARWARDVSDRVSSVQYAALEALELMPGASQKELCDELGLDRSTIADLIQRMERAGLIARSKDHGDRRRNVLALTPSGHDELVTLRPLVDRLQDELTAALSTAETAELRRLLGRLIDAEDAERPAAVVPQ